MDVSSCHLKNGRQERLRNIRKEVTAGDVLFLLDNETKRDDVGACFHLVNQGIGFIFQSFHLIQDLRVIDNVELPLLYRKISAKERRKLANEALERVGLKARTNHFPSQLSGGQQQRVAIARALVTEPSLVLADEPTGNLDSRSGTEVMQIFQNLNRKNNITTILVTHDVWIARHADRVIMLRDGKIIADHYVKEPVIAGEAERPTETQELQAIFKSTYYDGDEDEYN